jgi:hypothetical protein
MSDFGEGSWRQRPRLFGHGVPLVGVAAIAVFNGTLFSPIFDSISYYVSTFARDSYFDGLARGSLFYSPQLNLDLNLAAVFISLMTLLIAGIPAAVYERVRGLKASTPVSLGIWLVSAVLLSLPTILRMMAGDEF